MLTDTDWDIRLFIYKSLAAGAGAPDVDAVSARFKLSPDDSRLALVRLHHAHALVLRAGTSEILMANPLSARPTDYRVLIGDSELYANCAWDSLGIPAMLGADARIEARHPLTGEGIEYVVEGGRLFGCHDGLVHFALPFRLWYDDIIDT